MCLNGVNNSRVQVQELRQSCEVSQDIEIQSTNDLVNILRKMSEQLELQSKKIELQCKEITGLKNRVEELTAEQNDMNDFLLEKKIIQP